MELRIFSTIVRTIIVLGDGCFMQSLLSYALNAFDLKFSNILYFCEKCNYGFTSLFCNNLRAFARVMSAKNSTEYCGTTSLDRSNDENLASSSDDNTVRLEALPSSSGCSSAKSMQNKLEKKRMIQSCLGEVRKFLEHYRYLKNDIGKEDLSAKEDLSFKSATINTLEKVLIVLRNNFENSQLKREENDFHFMLQNNIGEAHDCAELAQSSLILELCQEDGIARKVVENVGEATLERINGSRTTEVNTKGLELWRCKSFYDSLCYGSPLIRDVVTEKIKTYRSSKSGRRNIVFIKKPSNENVELDLSNGAKSNNEQQILIEMHEMYYYFDDRKKALMINLSPTSRLCQGSKVQGFTKHAANGRIIFVDDNFSQSLGYTTEDLIGQSALGLLKQSSLYSFEESQMEALKCRGKIVKWPEYVAVSSDGSLCTINSEWSAYIDPWNRRLQFIAGLHWVHAPEMHKNEPQEPYKINLKFYKEACERLRNLDAERHQIEQRMTNNLSQPVGGAKAKNRDLSEKASKEESTRSKSIGKVAQRRSTGSSGGLNRNRDADASDEINITSHYDGAKMDPAYSTRGISCHVSTFFEKMVEHEYFMTRAPPLHLSNGDFWRTFASSGEANREVRASGSTVDTFSASPPDSYGSGPSYNEIARLENVSRLLNSQEGGISSDESAENTIKGVSIAKQRCSTITRPQSCTVDQNRAVIEALYKSPPVITNQIPRNQSATSLPENDLTSENLYKFTKLQARQHKENWRRRFSQGTLAARCDPNTSMSDHGSVSENRILLENKKESSSRGLKRSYDDSKIVLSRGKVSRSVKSNHSPIFGFEACIHSQAPKDQRLNIIQQPINLSVRYKEEAENKVASASTSECIKSIILPSLKRYDSQGDCWYGGENSSTFRDDISLRGSGQLQLDMPTVRYAQPTLNSQPSHICEIDSMTKSTCFTFGGNNSIFNHVGEICSSGNSLALHEQPIVFQENQLLSSDGETLLHNFRTEHFNSCSEIISSIREATESSIMLSER